MIAYREKYDFNFAYLNYPHSPFDLAIFEDSNGVVARPIIDLDNPPHAPFFTYMGKVFKTDNFETRDDSIVPESITNWLDARIQSEPLTINLEMAENEKELFDVMLERKKIKTELRLEEINRWLSKK